VGISPLAYIGGPAESSVLIAERPAIFVFASPAWAGAGRDAGAAQHGGGGGQGHHFAATGSRIKKFLYLLLAVQNKA